MFMARFRTESECEDADVVEGTSFDEDEDSRQDVITRKPGVLCICCHSFTIISNVYLYFYCCFLESLSSASRRMRLEVSGMLFPLSLVELNIIINVRVMLVIFQSIYPFPFW